jgi:hypothetical protein
MFLFKTRRYLIHGKKVNPLEFYSRNLSMCFNVQRVRRLDAGETTHE